MRVALAYDPTMATYRFQAGHPLRPERFSLTAELMERWGLLRLPGDEADDARALWMPAAERATDADIESVHDRALIAAVKAASVQPAAADPRFGLGPGDTPAFSGMHEAAARSVAGTMQATSAVISGQADRAFAPAGGMHHAHRDRVAGFCIYNDCAIAIERATRDHPGLRVAYVDIDAHHGDGVQEAFYDRPDVLTASVHESGRYLYPGTGFARDTGEGAGTGAALNVPLEPYTGDSEFLAAIDEVVAPAVAAFAPDLLVFQLGGDSHHRDPLTQLQVTLPGYVAVVDRLIAMADDVTGGRFVATGGGGYQPFDAVPRMWASAMARFLGHDVPHQLPAEWLAHARELGGDEAPVTDVTLADAM